MGNRIAIQRFERDVKAHVVLSTIDEWSKFLDFMIINGAYFDPLSIVFWI